MVIFSQNIIHTRIYMLLPARSILFVSSLLFASLGHGEPRDDFDLLRPDLNMGDKLIFAQALCRGQPCRSNLLEGSMVDYKDVSGKLLTCELPHKTPLTFLKGFERYALASVDINVNGKHGDCNFKSGTKVLLSNDLVKSSRIKALWVSSEQILKAEVEKDKLDKLKALQ